MRKDAVAAYELVYAALGCLADAVRKALRLSSSCRIGSLEPGHGVRGGKSWPAELVARP